MTTQQDKSEKDMNRNPDGKGGFGDNPQNRNPGGWNKEESISYWYNKIGRMSDDELKEFKPANQNQKIALRRITEALSDLATTKEITDRTEGKSPQFIGFGDGDDFDKRAGATIVFEDKPEED